jgi:hypothetical protein
MRQTHSQVNTLLVLVAVLAVVGGLAIVAATSPQSFQLGSLLAFFGGPSATPTPTTTSAPTVTATVAEATATIAVTPTRRPTLLPALVTTAQPATATTQLSASPTATEIQLPADAVALAEVQVLDAVNGRVRDVPNGDVVIAVVPNGTQVFVLQGQQQIGDVIWMEVRTPDGQTGWMADFLLKIIYRRP